MVTTILVERRGQAGYQDQGATGKHLHEKWSQVSGRREEGYHEKWLQLLQSAASLLVQGVWDSEINCS